MDENKLMVQDVPAAKPRYTRAQLDLIKRTVAKGATDDEFAFFLEWANRAGFDPFLGECHFQKRRQKVWQDGKMVGYEDRPVFIAGIHGMTARAEREPDFRGLFAETVRENDEFSYEPITGEISHKIKNGDRGGIIGAWAKLFKEGKSPITVFLEYGDFVNDSPFWQRSPSWMMKKDAKMAALRQAYPSIYGRVYEPGEQNEISSLSQEETKVEILQDDGKFQEVWHEVCERIRKVGEIDVSAPLRLLKEINPQVVTVKGWMMEVRNRNGESEMLHRYDELLKRELLWSEKKASSVPPEKTEDNIPEKPESGTSALGNGHAKTSEWTAERGPHNPHGLTLSAVKLWERIQKWSVETGKNEFLPSEIPFPGRSGHAGGQFVKVGLEFERAGLIRRTEKGYLILNPPPSAILPARLPNEYPKPIELPAHEDGLDGGEDDSWGEVPEAEEGTISSDNQ